MNSFASCCGRNEQIAIHFLHQRPGIGERFFTCSREREIIAARIAAGALALDVALAHEAIGNIGQRGPVDEVASETSFCEVPGSRRWKS